MSPEQQASNYVAAMKLSALIERLKRAGAEQAVAIEVIDQAFRIGCDVTEKTLTPKEAGDVLEQESRSS